MLTGSSVDFERINDIPAMKNVIGKEFFNAVINKLMLKIGEDHSIQIGDTSIRINDKGNLVFDEKRESKNEVPAIYKILRQRKDKAVFEIKAHPILTKLFEMKQYSSMKFPITAMPMLVPPLPWSSTQRGGFVLRPSVFCRLPFNGLGEVELKELSKKRDTAYPIFDSLNQLGK